MLPIQGAHHYEFLKAVDFWALHHITQGKNNDKKYLLLCGYAKTSFPAR
jgi:hypothetical protein